GDQSSPRGYTLQKEMPKGEGDARRSDSQGLDHRLKGRRLLTPARVIQEEAREPRAPVLEDAHELAPGDVGRRVLLQRVSEPQTVQRGPARKRDVVEDEGPRHRDGHRFAALFELPPVDGAAGAHPVPDAAV